MANIKTSSAETLRAYRHDLSQAFELDESKIPSVEVILSGGVEPCQKSHTPLQMLDEAALLERCRIAQQLWAGLAPASRNRKAATLKSFLGWLHSEGLIDQALAARVHAPKVPQRLPHHLSVDEALALLSSLEAAVRQASSANQALIAHRNLLLVLLLYGGGLRVSEACRLTWDRVDLDRGLLRVQGKGGKERMVAVPPLASRALADFRVTAGHDDTKSNFVFGEIALGTRKAYTIVQTSGATAGLLKPLHPHALRHSFATHLLSSGANLRSLQELLGHKSLQATQRYTHLGIDQLARTLESFHPLGKKS